MSEFKIKVGAARQVKNDLNKISGNINSIHGDIGRVKRSLRWKVQSRDFIEHKLNMLLQDIERNKNTISSCSSILDQSINTYCDTELSLVENPLEIASLSKAYDNTAKTFDDDKKNGTYGADQGDMAHNKKGIPFFSFRWFEDEELFAYIRKYKQYENYSQSQIADLMDRINNEGCGYIAIVNNLYVEFEGKEKEFEKIFGFPMYDENGRANYDYLIVDFYASTDDKFFIDEPMGATALVNDVINRYIDVGEDSKAGEVDFKKKYGCEPLINGKEINPVARQKILDEYQDKTVATLESSGTTIYSLENRFRHYMNQKGIACESMLEGTSLDADSINCYLDEGKNVNIAVGGFHLYDKNGKQLTKETVPNHWMTITDVTDDGRLVVSSWGKRYYLKQNELQDPSYYITDIFP